MSQHHITTLLQGYVLGAASGSQESTQSTHCKDRRGGEEPPAARVQLMGQLVVTSSQWPPLTQGIKPFIPKMQKNQILQWALAWSSRNPPECKSIGYSDVWKTGVHLKMRTLLLIGSFLWFHMLWSFTNVMDKRRVSGGLLSRLHKLEITMFSFWLHSKYVIRTSSVPSG